MLQLGLKVDQANTEPWKGRWVNATSSPGKNFLPILRESFVPSIRKLTAVEVELIADQSNTPTTGDIEIWISNNAKRMIVADGWKTVSSGECDHVLFLFPGKGLLVSPGQVYTIQLIGADRVFGWKYVLGGYKRGAASAPYGSNPPLPDTRSTFLFKSFGAD